MVVAAADMAVEAKTKLVVDARDHGNGCDRGLWPWARSHPGVASRVVAKTTATFSRGLQPYSWPRRRWRVEAMADAVVKFVTEVTAVVLVFAAMAVARAWPMPHGLCEGRDQSQAAGMPRPKVAVGCRARGHGPAARGLCRSPFPATRTPILNRRAGRVLAVPFRHVYLSDLMSPHLDLCG